MRVILLLLTIPALIYGWTRETWGRSELKLQENGRGSPSIKFYYRKATFPICHRLTTSGSYKYGRQREDTTIEYATGSSFHRQDTRNYAKRRKVQYKWERGWAYEGLLTPRDMWITATVTFYCSRYRHGGKLLETLTGTAVRSVFGIHGLIFHPYNGKISYSLAISNWNYNHIEIECFYGPKRNRLSKVHCNPRFGKYLRDYDMIIIDCGSTIPYGVTDLRCYSKTVRPSGLNYNLWSIDPRVLWWPGLKDKATKPLKPFIRPPIYKDSNDQSNGVLTIPYVSLRHSIQDKMFYVISHDTRFSSFSFANVTGNFKIAKRTESCDPDGGIPINGNAVASQSTEYGGYPASNAINGKLGDFSHTKAKYDQWWMVRKDDWPGVGYLQIRLRRSHWHRARKLTILTALYKGSLTPALYDDRWTKQIYQEAGAPDGVLHFQFLPVVQLNYLSIYSQNQLNAVELAEVITEGSCVKTSQQGMKLPIGLDFSVTAKSMIERTKATSDNTYNRFSTIPMEEGLMVPREICLTYRFEVLRDYFGCTAANSISAERKASCRARKLQTLKELVACLDPDVPIPMIHEDRIPEEKLELQNIDAFTANWGWFR